MRIGSRGEFIAHMVRNLERENFLYTFICALAYDHLECQRVVILIATYLVMTPIGKDAIVSPTERPEFYVMPVFSSITLGLLSTGFQPLSKFDLLRTHQGSREEFIRVIRFLLLAFLPARDRELFKPLRPFLLRPRPRSRWN